MVIKIVCNMPRIIFGFVGLLVALINVSCTAPSFKAIDQLELGMSKPEARTVMAAYGLFPRDVVKRPKAGWPKKGPRWMDPRRWAAEREVKLSREISSGEAYDAHHGLLGFGVVLLFYDGSGRLMDKYRYQIN